MSFANAATMIRNYITSGLRSLLRQRSFAAINILGFSLGLACFITLTLYVSGELRVDRHLEHADRIYRVLREDSVAAGISHTASLIGLFAPELEDRFPAVETSVRLHRKRAAVAVDQQVFEMRSFYWADDGALEMFELELDEGDPLTALARPNTVVLSKEWADKLFPETRALGQVVTVENTRALEVTGVLAESDRVSHLRPGGLASMATLGDMQNPWVGDHQGSAYVRLAHGIDARKVEADINRSISEFVWWFILENKYTAYRLQPLPDVYLRSAGITGGGVLGDLRSVLLFSGLALLVLIVACINYTNLATARSLRRAREVGVRKTLGASRRQLVAQFLSEAGLATLIGLGVGLLLTELTLPAFNRIAGLSLSADVLGNRAAWIVIITATLLTTLAAGSYPAFHLSRWRPSVSLGHGGRRQAALTRKGLIVVQFAVSAGLLFVSVVVQRQMYHVQSRGLGFDTEQIIQVTTRGLASDHDTFKGIVKNMPGVLEASFASGMPMTGWRSTSELGGRKVEVQQLMVDTDYLPTMGLELSSGRDLNQLGAGSSSNDILVNETYARLAGWTDPLSESLPLGADADGNPVGRRVVGVVRDFHTGSLHNAIVPVIFDATEGRTAFRSRLLVRVAPGTGPETMRGLEQAWTLHAPGFPFSAVFVDELIDGLYETDLRTARLLGLFTALSLLIASMGLFGLAAFAAEQRTREIGIRKTFGASTQRLTAMLSGDFLKLIAVAVLPSIPVAWILANRWLENFVYRISIGPLDALLSVAALLAVACLAVAQQSIRAAWANPARSLRHD